MIPCMTDYRKALANNIQKLMQANNISSQAALARKTGIDQKTINNLLNAIDRDIHPNGETLKGLATYFKVDEWLLMAPDMPIDLLKNKTVEKLFSNYRDANEEGKREILRVSENEVRYSHLPDQTVNKNRG